MSVLEDLGRLSAAEEFFTYLDVPYDATIVQVARLHILRRMGQYLKGSEVDGTFAGLGEEEVKRHCREHLAQAYQDFVDSSPLKERLFKVHKEAVAPKPAKPMVSLTPIKLDEKSSDQDVA
ncbi:MAG TPA: nitrogenase stabilizing/protective protein NifW [Methylocella sp.]|nr:nitrogenase stabilizing/protective protein NifW [Methylocella sp.]